MIVLNNEKLDRFVEWEIGFGASELFKLPVEQAQTVAWVNT